MSLSTHTLKRISTIKADLRKGLNRTTIGKHCGVTERTIDRDIKAWVNSGLFETWIREEFLDLHNYVRDADPTEAYRQVSKLVAKMITQKAEIKSEHKETVKIIDMNKLLERYEQSINRAIKGNIRQNSPHKQMDTR